jgi:hypothetical protein
MSLDLRDRRHRDRSVLLLPPRNPERDRRRRFRRVRKIDDHWRQFRHVQSLRVRELLMRTGEHQEAMNRAIGPFRRVTSDRVLRVRRRDHLER